MRTPTAAPPIRLSPRSPFLAVDPFAFVVVYKARMAKGLPRVVLPWMEVDREERRRRLLAFFESQGDRMAAAHAAARLDDPLTNLCGECGPVLDELHAGVSVDELAAKWGVSERNVYGHLLKWAPEEFRGLQANGAIGRRRFCTERLEEAADNVSVSKWRALLQSAEWDLEKLLPKLYGQKQDVGGLQITVNVDRSCGGAVTIEAGEGGGVPQRLVIEGAEASVAGGAG